LVSLSLSCPLLLLLLFIRTKTDVAHTGHVDEAAAEGNLVLAATYAAVSLLRLLLLSRPNLDVRRRRDVPIIIVYASSINKDEDRRLECVR
jgi:hypothetical protein